ncbi:MAG TPA: hypothetical protein VFV52_10195 [Bacilli bacterium]|nr:hypothetical protein [Bacilli bacterium]
MFLIVLCLLFLGTLSYQLHLNQQLKIERQKLPAQAYDSLHETAVQAQSLDERWGELSTQEQARALREFYPVLMQTQTDFLKLGSQYLDTVPDAIVRWRFASRLFSLYGYTVKSWRHNLEAGNKEEVPDGKKIHLLAEDLHVLETRIDRDFLMEAPYTEVYERWLKTARQQLQLTEVTRVYNMEYSTKFR